MSGKCGIEQIINNFSCEVCLIFFFQLFVSFFFYSRLRLCAIFQSIIFFVTGVRKCARSTALNPIKKYVYPQLVVWKVKTEQNGLDCVRRVVWNGFQFYCFILFDIKFAKSKIQIIFGTFWFNQLNIIVRMLLHCDQPPINLDKEKQSLRFSLCFFDVSVTIH